MSPLLDVDIAAGVAGRLRAVLTAQPDAVAVVDHERALTFAELIGHASAVAETVRDALGNEPDGGLPRWEPRRTPPGGEPCGPDRSSRGDPQPVAVLCGHHTGAVATVLGVVLSGYPLMVLDPGARPAGLRGSLDRVGARICLADADHARPAVEAVAGKAGRVLRTPAELVAPAGTPDQLWAGAPDPGSPAVLGVASGPTGRPEVVTTDHRQIVGDCWMNSTASRSYGVHDVVAHALPMSRAAGLTAALAGPLVGAVTALYDVRRRGIAGLPDWLHEVGATVLHASSAILAAFVAAEPPPHLLAGLRSVTVAADPTHGRDVAAVRRLLPFDCTVFTRYGRPEPTGPEAGELG